MIDKKNWCSRLLATWPEFWAIGLSFLDTFAFLLDPLLAHSGGGGGCWNWVGYMWRGRSFKSWPNMHQRRYPQKKLKIPTNNKQNQWRKYLYSTSCQRLNIENFDDVKRFIIMVHYVVLKRQWIGCWQRPLHQRDAVEAICPPFGPLRKNLLKWWKGNTKFLAGLDKYIFFI